jgi:outer membrane lipoprotein-sorting protein
MKKAATICLLGFFLLGLMTSLDANLEAQEKDSKKSDPKALKLIEKMIKAQGGRELIKSIKDTNTTGTIEFIQMGLEGVMTLYQKEPNMMRIDIEMMGMIITQAFDGEMAWFINPQTGISEEMPEQQADNFKRQALGQDSLLNPEKLGITYTYKGLEKIEEKDFHVLVQTHADGWEATLWVDKETNLVHKSKAETVNEMGVEVEAESFTTDYQEVNGMMVAHTMNIYQDGEEFMTITLTEVNFNTGLEESFFKMEE